jgi:hypothetical protein
LSFPSVPLVLPQADRIALGVGEPGKGARGNRDWRHQHFSTQGTGPLQASLHVVHLDVKDGVIVRFVPQGCDVSADIISGSDEGRGTGIVHLPVEQLVEEFLRFGEVAAANFKMADRVRHGCSPFVMADFTTDAR